ncbi:HAD-like domain-containing protein [Halteromyces radiatus]|uniref:HAD-like domain-containing protein n=1 Tax=Halteromyces radiatus TaxID=101107 RepID=UPI00221FE116|nr:HAD-like domain-containing protein [Halteromyces radiatus]KAI8088899.1 HAD-like domain-containing protein [Halteromyces radiatus]
MSHKKEVPAVEVSELSADGSTRDLASQFANRLNTQTGSSGPHVSHSDNIGEAPENASVSVKKEWALLRDPVIHTERLDAIRSKKGYIIDMDGVIYHGATLLPGAKELVEFLQTNNKKFLFLTNNSAPTPRELQSKLERLGINVGEEHFFTSGQATAYFLKSQSPDGGTVYVIGEPGLAYSLYDMGFFMNDHNPDYVVLGESQTYNFEKLTKAVQLVQNGAKLIATHLDTENLDSVGNKIPATGAFTACVELVTNTKAFFCGKPSALIMRYAQRVLGLSRLETCIIGDRMDTDIVAGITSEIDPVLVLSGVTSMDMLQQYAYRPYLILGGVYEIPDEDERHLVTDQELEDASRRVSDQKKKSLY